MSVLVMVEMFNALNNLSENGSLLSIPPWHNLWLLAAIAVSVLLHLMIVYVPWFESLFSVIHLSWGEWRMVLLLSAPVVLVDEALKLLSRRKARQAAGAGRPGGARARRSSSSSDSGMLVPLRSIEVVGGGDKYC
jgi:magnesium-transporting ATPase (P-type)